MDRPSPGDAGPRPAAAVAAPTLEGASLAATQTAVPGAPRSETPPRRRRGPRALAAWFRRALHRSLEASNRLRLPGPSVLPVAGAIVGIYAGLAAGIFQNLIRLFRGFAEAPRTLPMLLRAPNALTREAFLRAPWHPELAVVGLPLAAGVLVLSRVIRPGGPRDTVKRRLRVLALLVMGALGLYYPLVGLASLDALVGAREDADALLRDLPVLLIVLAPAVGGWLVGWLLRNRPETHGHGVPEVVEAVKGGRNKLAARTGLLKLLASSITIGSGGSAGREGPIVYGGAAFGASVGRTLGFSRKELSILMASGAGAGIAASFNAPVAGAMFAMEIILREFELKVFSPIILASVSATLVGRTVMGQAPMLKRFTYQMVSGWEAFGYAALGLVCGLVAFAFVRLLHACESFFQGHVAGKLSARLGQAALPWRAGIGGLGAGLLAAVSPAVRGTGHEFVNLAAAGELSLAFLAVACLLKLVGTSLTIGSGGSGGTFFPSVVMGSLAGGAFGVVMHALFPAAAAPSGAYAMVGMGGVVAGFTRGPLTGMMMVYELSGNYAIILPLMVTCTIASALCHALAERRSATEARSREDLMHHVPVSDLVVAAPPVPAATRVSALADLLLATEGGALAVLDARGGLAGVVQVHHLREVWSDAALSKMLNAADVMRPVHAVAGEDSLATALERMDQDDVDALPVTDKEGALLGLVTRAGINRFVRHNGAHPAGEQLPVAATEL